MVASVGPMASIKRWNGYPRKATSSASEATASTQQIDEKNPELAGNRPESDDQSAAENQGQDADQQHSPAQRGTQTKLSLPAGTEDQAHAADGLAAPIEYARHCGVAQHQQKEQNAALDERKPNSGGQGRWRRGPKCSGQYRSRSRR